VHRVVRCIALPSVYGAAVRLVFLGDTTLTQRPCSVCSILIVRFILGRFKMRCKERASNDNLLQKYKSSLDGIGKVGGLGSSRALSPL
jgi:hypothetical protein